MLQKVYLQTHFTDCPPCYDLVLDRVRIHRQKLAELREIVENVGKNPGSINDTDFRRRMNEVNESVNQLLNDARGAVGKHRIEGKGGALNLTSNFEISPIKLNC